MQKSILMTGATDGIGLETARKLVRQGHLVLLHGRNPAKLEAVEKELSAIGRVESYVADLSNLTEVNQLADAVKAKHDKLDVLINNAGIFKTPKTLTADGLDVRFAVNTIAPYLLTRSLLPRFGTTGRIINLSSAAQSSLSPTALVKGGTLSDMEAYAQSKLALTMWSNSLAEIVKERGIMVVAVNPGSYLASKMVKEGFGVAGHDLSIGADILCRAALSDEFASASGKYFDNDSGQFTNPHPDTLDSQKVNEVVATIETILSELSIDSKIH